MRHTHLVFVRQFRTCKQVRWLAQPPGAPPRAAIGTGSVQRLHVCRCPRQCLSINRTISHCTLLCTGRSLDHRNTTGAQRASSARSVSPLVCSSDCLPASPPYACSSPSHANRSTGQRNTTQSSTVLLARPVCPHVCDSDSARATTPSSFFPCVHLNPSTLRIHSMVRAHLNHKCDLGRSAKRATTKRTALACRCSCATRAMLRGTSIAWTRRSTTSLKGTGTALPA